MAIKINNTENARGKLSKSTSIRLLALVGAVLLLAGFLYMSLFLLTDKTNATTTEADSAQKTSQEVSATTSNEPPGLVDGILNALKDVNWTEVVILLIASAVVIYFIATLDRGKPKENK